MPPGFQAHRDDRVHARRLRFLGMQRAGHHLQPFDARLACAADVLLRSALRRDDDRHAFRNGNVHVLLGTLVVQRDVDGERRVGAAAYFAHGGKQGLGIHRAGGDDAQPARAGIRQRKRRVG
ncbi:hypothetical protein G6F58_013106 [Rhizopus delemar]|nr:hypothetical protein G6F58_013106 [Rhizopus delemar]